MGDALVTELIDAMLNPRAALWKELRELSADSASRRYEVVLTFDDEPGPL
ncbi:hypothetical protein [Bradyrhizobium ottawaense]|nr:hypothetical protein [Bradyrhizobium ottawaense]